MKSWRREGKIIKKISREDKEKRREERIKWKEKEQDFMKKENIKKIRINQGVLEKRDRLLQRQEKERKIRS